ncbi:TonB family protein [Bradyrhizobium sp. Pear76]|uniref:energy transducer TonB family protein n=1 Tax=Bradyrhizobium oropedii TaxID=1571201 RepID=UPI001E2CCFE6|nr:energy transducer TonB [Bradyrhizobium oropedii]MCC8966016.1 TonB family protein [Bradyrhizobium oropedii]
MSDSSLDQRTSKRLWLIAAVTAVGLHLGGAALALTNLRGDDGDEGLGAAGAEYSVELATANVEDDSAPPGPPDQAQQAAPEMTQQKAEVKDTNLPQAKPTEAENPDYLVTEDNSKKPKEEDTQVAKVQTEAQQASEQHEDRAPTKLEDATRQSDTTKAPNPGIGKDRLALTAKWGKKLSAYFELHKKYPEDKDKTTKVTLDLVINRRGNIVSVKVADSSGDSVFDDEAVAMVRRSDPVPQPPAGLTDDQFPFSLPVHFKKPKK